MKKTSLVFICCIGLILAIPSSYVKATDLKYIYITNPFLKKIPLAIPLFKPNKNHGPEISLSVKATDLLAHTLEFTGYFHIVERDRFLMGPNKAINYPSDLNFNDWTVIGAELLIIGSVSAEGNMIQMELRLMDTFKGRMLIGKRYKGEKGNYREMIRRFCSDVILFLTGKEGIFNSKIAFVSGSSGKKEIFISDFDGYNAKQYTQGQKIALFPSWSSDGKWLAYTSYKKDKPDLYIRHIKDNRGTIVAKEGINSTPAWVPGKFELAATHSFSGDPEIYLLTGKGKITKRLTQNHGIDSSPTFSPDGKKMAFVSNRSGNPQIYVMDLNTFHTRRLTFHGKYNTQPDWSKVGDKIVFTSMEKGINDINVINADGTGQIQLTHESGNNESPSWSPDGNLIVFSSTREGPSKIYIMTSIGTDQRRLLDLPGEQTNPKWSPRKTIY